jgi:hypothetical protein
MIHQRSVLFPDFGIALAAGTESERSSSTCSMTEYCANVAASKGTPHVPHPDPSYY